MHDGRDISLLEDLLACDELAQGERDAFADMLARLRDRQRMLTPKQLGWVERRHTELGLGDSALRNANVPRGREVEPAEVLRKRPLKPPGRETAAGRVLSSFIYGRSGATVDETDGCGGTRGMHDVNEDDL